MSAGGKREGAGRRKGSPNKTTAQRIAEVAASGLTPLDHMLQVMRDPLQPAERRDWAAEKAAPYCHAKLAQKDVNVTQTIDVADRIIARWKQNLAKLNAEDPLPNMIEGRAIDVTPGRNE